MRNDDDGTDGIVMRAAPTDPGPWPRRLFLGLAALEIVGTLVLGRPPLAYGGTFTLTALLAYAATRPVPRSLARTLTLSGLTLVTAAVGIVDARHDGYAGTATLPADLATAGHVERYPLIAGAALLALAVLTRWRRPLAWLGAVPVLALGAAAALSLHQAPAVTAPSVMTDAVRDAELTPEQQAALYRLLQEARAANGPNTVVLYSYSYELVDESPIGSGPTPEARAGAVPEAWIGAGRPAWSTDPWGGEIDWADAGPPLGIAVLLLGLVALVTTVLPSPRSGIDL
ncbi:hypothetical protein [Actinoplanes sp. NPDC051851]|uniref:hypothetical protein n=1 Tax=Actinoplanes sp. NPDC051851 TaxID=3154753 RepID=UPI003448ABB7